MKAHKKHLFEDMSQILQQLKTAANHRGVSFWSHERKKDLLSIESIFSAESAAKLTVIVGENPTVLSTLARQWLLYIATEKNAPVLLYSHQTTTENLSLELLSQLSNLPSKVIEHHIPTSPMRSAIKNAISGLELSNIFLCQGSSLTVHGLNMHYKTFKEQLSTKRTVPLFKDATVIIGGMCSAFPREHHFIEKAEALPVRLKEMAINNKIHIITTYLTSPPKRGLRHNELANSPDFEAPYWRSAANDIYYLRIPRTVAPNPTPALPQIIEIIPIKTDTRNNNIISTMYNVDIPVFNDV